MNNRLGIPMHISYIGLGSNLDNPVKQIKLAISSILSHHNIDYLDESGLYESKPYDNSQQPNYINAVLKIATTLSAHELLHYLQSIEQQQARERKKKWAARTIDLDILFFNKDNIFTEELTIPHYDIKNRLFFLYPLFEIEPDYIFPDGTILRECLNQFLLSDLHKISS